MNNLEINNILYNNNIIGYDKCINNTTTDESIDIIYNIAKKLNKNQINNIGIVNTKLLEFHISNIWSEDDSLAALKKFIESNLEIDDVSFINSIIFDIEKHIYQHLTKLAKSISINNINILKLTTDELKTLIDRNISHSNTNKNIITNGYIGSEIVENYQTTKDSTNSIYKIGHHRDLTIYINAYSRFDDCKILISDANVFNFYFELNENILKPDFFNNITPENDTYSINIGKVHIKYNDNINVDSLEFNE